MSAGTVYKQENSFVPNGIIKTGHGLRRNILQQIGEIK